MSARPLVLAALVLFGCGPTFEPGQPPARIERVITAPLGDNTPEEEFRSQPPPALGRRPRRLGSPIVVRLPNGARLVMLERHDFPSVATVFALDRGASAAPGAVAAMYRHAMTGTSEANTRMDAFMHLQYMGASVATEVSQGGVFLYTRSLTPFFAVSLSYVGPMFAAPALWQSDVDRARNELSADRQLRHRSKAALANEYLVARLFPAPSPFGVPVEGVAGAQLNVIGREALIAFRDQNLAAENVVAVCVGHIAPDEVPAVIADALKSLPTKKTPRPAVPDAAPLPARLVIVNRPGAVQSDIAIGWRGPTASDRAFTALEILAAAKGADLSSSLNALVREELGATYGVRMRTHSWRSSGAVLVTAAVETRRTADALRIILRDIERSRAEPMDERSLGIAKSHVDADLETGTNQGIARQIAQAIVDGQPPSFVTDRHARVEAVSAEAVMQASERWLAQSPHIVVVGDASRIAEELGTIGIPVETTN
jgi:zinc protease